MMMMMMMFCLMALLFHFPLNHSLLFNLKWAGSSIRVQWMRGVPYVPTVSVPTMRSLHLKASSLHPIGRPSLHLHAEYTGAGDFDLSDIDGDHELEQEMSLDLYRSLCAPDEELLSVRNFLQWDDVLEVLERGSIDEDTIRLIFGEVGVTGSCSHLTFEQFVETVDLINQVEAACEGSGLLEEEDFEEGEGEEDVEEEEGIDAADGQDPDYSWLRGVTGTQ